MPQLRRTIFPTPWKKSHLREYAMDLEESEISTDPAFSDQTNLKI